MSTTWLASKENPQNALQVKVERQMSNNQINLTSAEALIRKKAGDQAEIGIELLKVCAETVQLISTSSALPGMFSTGEPIKSQNQPSQISAHAHLTNYALYSQKLADSFVGRFEEMFNISLIWYAAGSVHRWSQDL
uniref:(California timema) hypothetical protein n=1 Tax=Timema californicum TaxID=61474 RepID=A0A7R9J6D4_TIMCA|nr:unnamed protein product [Timema californicum]